jgi:parallel beta-helix repeat protein
MVAPLIAVTGISSSQSTNTEYNVVPVVHLTDTYTPHAPFNITCDDDFVTQLWPGSGTPSSPYLIEGLNVTGDYCAIGVFDTTKYFKIKDCFIKANSTYDGGNIFIANATHGILENNYISSGFIGIGIYNSTRIEMYRNGFTGQEYDSCYLQNFNDSIVQGCYSAGNTIAFPFGLVGGKNVSITDSVFLNVTRSMGMELLYLDACEFVNNTLMGHPDWETYFTWGGVEFMGVDSTFSNNTIGGFMFNDLYVNGHNITLEHNTLLGSSTGLVVASPDSEVRYNYFTDCSEGLTLVDADRCLVEYNTFEDYYGTGIAVYGGDDITIRYNSFINGYYGITMMGAHECLVQENTITDCPNGIFLGVYSSWGSVADGPPVNCTIASNTLVRSSIQLEFWVVTDYDLEFGDNTIDGEAFGYFFSSIGQSIIAEDYGQLFLVGCFNTTVSDGSFYNSSYPITLLFCGDCTVSDIDIVNPQMGIVLRESEDCVITRCNVSADEQPTMTSHPRMGVTLGGTTHCNVTDNELWYLTTAMGISGSDFVFISQNSVHHNLYGMSFGASTDCLTTNNLIFNNTGYGIDVDGNCARNSFYSNQIGWNGVNAQCRSASNYWDNQVDTGNLWSDYTGEGNYLIDTAGIDHYPGLLTELTYPSDEVPGMDFMTLALITAGVGVVVVVVVAVIIKKR